LKALLSDPQLIANLDGDGQYDDDTRLRVNIVKDAKAIIR